MIGKILIIGILLLLVLAGAFIYFYSGDEITIGSFSAKKQNFKDMTGVMEDGQTMRIQNLNTGEKVYITKLQG